MNEVAVTLIDPKFPHNVGGALRACGVFGASRLMWTGSRVPAPERWPEGARLPREERMKLYRDVDMLHYENFEALHTYRESVGMGLVPVAVEVLDSAEPLDTFDHPADAMYVFGPEDGSLPGSVRSLCHRFVTIPTTMRTPLNLSAAVNVVLYDRLAKQRDRAARQAVTDAVGGLTRTC